MDKQQVYVLLISNELNDNTIEDGSYESNSVDFSFLDSKYAVKLEYLTIENYKSVIDSIAETAYIINLCDGMDIDGRPGECVVKYLDENRRIYIGCFLKLINLFEDSNI